MADKSTIDYQMYLDYLDGKEKEEKSQTAFDREDAFQPTESAQRDKPLLSFEETFGTSEEKPLQSFEEETGVYTEKPLRSFEEEFGTSEATKTLSRLEEIERKYHLDTDTDDVAPMSDAEFEAKYGKKTGHSKHAPVEEDLPSEQGMNDPFEARVEEEEYEDVYSYDADKENSIPADRYDESRDEAERDLAGEDEYGLSDGGKNGKKGGKKGKAKKKKWWKILLAIVLILAVLGSIAYVKRADIIHFVTAKMMEGNNVGKEDTGVMKRLEKGDDQNHGDIFYESSAADTWSLEGWLDSWQKQEGQLMYNDKIINVLLIGMDNPQGATWGRSDSMILVSIDTIHQRLKLTSVWRDTYGLIQVPEIDNHLAYDTHEKINGANYYGGPECVVDTIESLYKIRIDGYVMTTFESFKDLIDAMGGINVDVEEYENEFLTRTAPISWHASAGKGVLLNGKEALVYSRIRHLDSDIKRTERQRKVMSAILKKADELNTTQIFKTVNSYLAKGYVTTNFSQNDISGLGTKAVFGGWKDFKMKQTTAPISGEVDPDNYAYYWGGEYAGAWVWLVDVPKTATDVQKFIYGETFCQLNEYRHSLSEFVSGGIH